MKNNMWLPEGDTFFETRGDYELRDYQKLMPYVTHRRVAVDIGAHVGYWSKRLVEDFQLVHAFEAEPTHSQCLKFNVVKPNIKFHEVAVSNKAGTVNFTKSIDNSGMSHVSETGDAVPCNPLDAYNLKFVDLIKIDVEGHELQVLEGAAETINRCTPVLFIEILNSVDFDTRNKILQLLHSWDYTLKDKVAENYIFVRYVHE
jgi:FkbM family methyltransferase